MRRKDIVEMYKKGYSIEFIINTWYHDRIKNDIPSHRFGNSYIITKKSCSCEEARREVEEVIIHSLKN